MAVRLIGSMSFRRDASVIFLLQDRCLIDVVVGRWKPRCDQPGIVIRHRRRGERRSLLLDLDRIPPSFTFHRVTKSPATVSARTGAGP